MNITKYYILNKKNYLFFDLNFDMLLLYKKILKNAQKKRGRTKMICLFKMVFPATTQILFHPEKTHTTPG